jgi:hypothetical protein
MWKTDCLIEKWELLGNMRLIPEEWPVTGDLEPGPGLKYPDA